MAASIVHHRRLVLVALAAIVLAGVLLLVWAGPPARAGGALTTTPSAEVPVVESVLVARSAGDHDALWLLSPLDGTPTAAGDLPGKAGSVAVSPDGANVAYLPANGGPRVWVGYGPLGPKTISLAAAGVRRVDSFTWIDDHRLVVSGATRASAGYYQDRLFLVNVTTGKTASFRDLRGTEPSAAPAVGKVAYVRLTIVKPGTAANRNVPTIRESLRVVGVAGGTGRTVIAETYRLYADHRSFAKPRLSPDGKWLLTGQTGSDVSVTYTIRDSGIGYPLLTISTGALLSQSGWNAAGRAAFGGTPNLTTADEACVWAYTRTGAHWRGRPRGCCPT